MLPVLVVIAGLAGVIETKPALIVTPVHIGEHGPFRFLVDTGAESSTIDPKLAGQLGLRPEFQVELVTLHGARLVPGSRIEGLRIGARQLASTELLFDDPIEARRLDPGIQGVLGANVLGKLSFQLTPRQGMLDLAAERPAGETIPFTLSGGRMMVKVRMGRELLTLALDSGASHIVLFRTPEAMRATHSLSTVVTTLEGARSVVPTTWTAPMNLTASLRLGMLPAAIVPRPGTTLDGLLPAALFKTLFVDHTHQELVVGR